MVELGDSMNIEKNGERRKESDREREGERERDVAG